MRVAKTEEFETLVNKYGLTQETVSDSIVKYLLKDDGFEKDGHDIWGRDIKGILEVWEELGVYQVDISVFCDIFEHWPDKEDMDSFMSLVVIGDHDCPECGGEMITIDSNLEVIMDPNGVQEPYDKIIGELKECSNCSCRIAAGAYFY